VNLLAGVSVLAATCLASTAFDSGQLSGVAIAVVAMIPMAVFEVIQANGAIFGVRIRYRASQNRIQDLIERTLPHSIRLSEGLEELKSIQNLEVQKITIEYDESSAVISNFDLKLIAGQNLALRGPSGSGKTSLAYALLRFLEPASGEYLINGRPAKDYSAESIRHRIGYIEQNPNIFLGSVRDNLALANPTSSDKELWAVLESVKLRKVFEAREGLSTQLGERGSLISSGEAQRVAIARALLANFELLILDEPTANLDSKTACALLDDVFAIAKNMRRSLVLITHDEEIAQRCDLVIELSQPTVEGA
jgi:ATP-binding cassette subfamily C protein CydC